MNFYYNFDIKKEFPRLANLPINELAEIESNIVQVIYESFLIPGDQDYLTARLLAQKGLHRAFFWAASQTIEKYLKAFLLLNGHSVINHKGHPIKKLLQGAIKVNKNLGDIHLNLHEDLNIDSENKKLPRSFTLDQFIKDIEIFGSPDNRYNASGVIFDTGHLFALDKLAYTFRDLMVPPAIDESFKNIDKSLITIFQDNNPLFSRTNNISHSKIPSPQFQIKKSMSGTRLDFLIKNNNSNNTIALCWLKSKMKLDKKRLSRICKI